MTDTGTDPMVSEHDLKLLHGLQIAPRVSWAEAARILDSTPPALAARFERLWSAGLAWMTAHRSGSYLGMVFALVEIDCVPGTRSDVIRTLCADRRVLTIEESARGRDLMLTVRTGDLPELTRLVLDEMPTVPGLERQRTLVCTAVHRDVSNWRLDALDQRETQGFAAAAQTTRTVPGTMPPPDAGPLIEALAEDGRRTAADIARVTGRNPATVRRQLPRLLTSGLVQLRCEVSQTVTTWSISSTWLARVAPADQKRTVDALATLPELRFCASTTGDANIAFTVWTHSPTDLLRLEHRIGAALPWMTVRDIGINLRTPKRMGRLLDQQGRATGQHVPLL
ncbi:Lrp/AsnC family transcriptional regulator [Streptomyces sp. NPDC056161]|uniref:Lrp/AsnC family transcriptional regulator n=1 Tax=Streptomyces sp. NPDC056161 TaxID=3345732 RepID=UPI0035E070E8